MVMAQLFDWMIMVNHIDANINIKKPVLMKPKNVSNAGKAYFLMLIMFPFQESASLLVLILENLMYVVKHK